MAAYWEIAAHLAYNMFSKYKYLIVNLVFPTSVFEVGILCLFLVIAYLNLFILNMFHTNVSIFLLILTSSEQHLNNYNISFARVLVQMAWSSVAFARKSYQVLCHVSRSFMWWQKNVQEQKSHGIFFPLFTHVIVVFLLNHADATDIAVPKILSNLLLQKQRRRSAVQELHS